MYIYNTTTRYESGESVKQIHNDFTQVSYTHI